MPMSGVSGARTDVQKNAWSGSTWLIQDRATGLYYGGDSLWVSSPTLAVRNATERDAQAWWDFHGDTTLVWFTEKR